MAESNSDISALLLPDERQAANYVLENHRMLLIDLPQGVLRFFNESLNSLPKGKFNEIRPSERVCMLLLGRIMQDIRSMSVCAMLSYPTSTAAIAASIFEISFEVIFLADNDEEANKWISHQITKHTSSDLNKRIGRYMDRIGIVGKEKAVMIEKYFEPYRIISMAKHGNSLLQRNMSLKEDRETEKLIIATGPDASDLSLAVIALSIQNALGVAMLALGIFHQEFHEEFAAEIVEMADKTNLSLLIEASKYPTIVPPTSA